MSEKCTNVFICLFSFLYNWLLGVMSNEKIFIRVSNPVVSQFKKRMEILN